MTTPVVLDAFDHRLLDLLQADAGRTLTALGEAVGLSPSAVQRRIKRYRANGLLRQVAVLDAEAFPSVVLATVWVTMERESVRQLNAFYARMRATPEVQQCYQLAGEWDYLVIMATTSMASYRETAERLFKSDGKIKRYRANGLLRQVAVLDAEAFPSVVLATVWVTMERESVRQLNAFYARMRATPEVQQCYQLAGEWDYLVIMATTSMASYRETAERLFKSDGNIKRYETRLVFDTVKRGLQLPTRAPAAKGQRKR